MQYGDCCSRPQKRESTSRIRTGEPILPHISPSGPSGVAGLPSAVVQLLLGTPEAHPPHTMRPSFSADRFGGLATTAPKKVKENDWEYRCPVAFKTVCVASACGIDMHIVSSLALRDGQTICVEDVEEECHHPLKPARQSHTTRYKHSRATSGPTFDG